MKRLVISRGSLETRVALLDGDVAVELYVERPSLPSLVGNIYKGRVENVLAGMDAAFVDIGMQRNGFLYVDEAGGAGRRGRSGAKITALLRSGKEVLVQVARDAMGSKGPRLTTQLALAGRCLVYLPQTPTVGASRRLEAEERSRLRDLCARLDLGPGEGLIARTAAEGADEKALERELRFLRHQWGLVKNRAAACSAPALAYAEAELALRAVRELLGAEAGVVVVDDAGLQRRLANFLRGIAPELAGMVELDEAGGLFERFGLEEEIAKALQRRVGLPSGGYLVIDHTEAMTVVDVNTGSYTGRRFLEDTILKTNLEACREVVRQLRLRDIGGIIVVDFIDMASPANREAVLRDLQAELAKDRTKSYVVEISPLGLVEMTRQNITRGLRETVTEACPRCRGDGAVLSEDSALIDVERRIRATAAGSSLPGVRVKVHPRIVDRLAVPGADTAGIVVAPGASLLGLIETATGRRIFVEKAGGHASLDHFEVVPD
jgi:ribonuclease G